MNDERKIAQKSYLKNAGITLIALVITIIILLILAGVSIATLTGNNGILTQANDAKTETRGASVEEKINIKKQEWNNSKLLKEKTESVTEVENELLNELIENGDIKESEIDRENKTIKIGKRVIDYTFKNSWYSDDSKSITDGNVTLQLGDYINYEPTDYEGYDSSNAKVEITKDESGYDSTQIFNLSSYKYGWRVLGIDGKTGGIELISEDTIEPDSGGKVNTLSGRESYTLKGYTGYVNGGKTFEKISSLYGKGKYSNGARSITIDDIEKLDNEITHRNETIAFYWDGTDYPQYKWENNEWFPKGSVMYKYTNGFYWIDDNDKLTIIPKSNTASKDNLEEIKTIKLNFYDNSKFAYGNNKNTKVYDVLFKSKNTLFQDKEDELSFWINTKEKNVSVYYDVIAVDYGYAGSMYGDLINNQELFSTYNGDKNCSGETLGIRPIVTLDPNIELVSSGEGTWTIKK